MSQLWGIDEEIVNKNNNNSILGKLQKFTYPSQLIHLLCSKYVIQFVSVICIWVVSYFNFILLPLVLELQFIVCLLLSWIHQHPSPGWYADNVKIIALPYGKQLYARPSNYTGNLMAFFVVISIIYPLPQVAIPLIFVVFIASVNNIIMGFSDIIDVVYGWIIGCILSILLLSQASWVQFLIISSSILISILVSFMIKKTTFGKSAQHTDFWLSHIKKTHTLQSIELVIDDRNLSIIYPNLIFILGYSIGISCVSAFRTTYPTRILDVSLPIYLILMICLYVSIRKTNLLLLVVVNFLIGCWIPLSTLIIV
jgi:hypothetical protein